MTYSNLDVRVRDLPPDHDPADRLAAMEQASRTAAPALGLFFSEKRPTLGDGFEDIAARATARPAGRTKAGRKK